MLPRGAAVAALGHPPVRITLALGAATLVLLPVSAAFPVVALGLAYVACLLIVVSAATHGGLGTGLVACFGSAAVFNTAFVPPREQPAVDDPDHLMAFASFLAGPLVVAATPGPNRDPAAPQRRAGPRDRPRVAAAADYPRRRRQVLKLAPRPGRGAYFRFEPPVCGP